MKDFVITTEEIWKDIEGYERLYEVSNFGRVRRVDSIDSQGRNWKGRILTPISNNKGYFIINLYKGGIGKHFLIHRLVAQAFLPNPEGLPVINHRDENPKNNQADNLEWCDQKYNLNYGTCQERIVQSKIGNGNADPEMCGIIKNEGMKKYQRLRYQNNKDILRERYQKNRDKILEQKREHYQKNREQILERQRDYRRRKKKQPSEESLW